MKIRALRNKKGYSQEYMDRMLGMVQNNYSKIELGDIELTVKRLEEISKLLEKDASFFLKGESESIVYSNNSLSGETISNNMNVTNPYADKVIVMLEAKVEVLEKELREKDLLIQQMKQESEK